VPLAGCRRNLSRETAWEAVMRIRCSKGLRISAFYGHFFIRSTDLLALPACDADKVGAWAGGRAPGWPGPRQLWQPARRASRAALAHSCLATRLLPPTRSPSPPYTHHHDPPPPPPQSFSVEITHEETLVTGQVAYLQAALLYTSSSGERRIRVHTLALPVVAGARRRAAPQHPRLLPCREHPRLCAPPRVPSTLCRAQAGLLPACAPLPPIEQT
jgi:hypothetical protein